MKKVLLLLVLVPNIVFGWVAHYAHNRRMTKTIEIKYLKSNGEKGKLLQDSVYYFQHQDPHWYSFPKIGGRDVHTPAWNYAYGASEECD